MRNKITRSQPRSKTNPNGRCFVCPNKIFNKKRNSKYCSVCTGEIKYAKAMFSQTAYIAKRKFKKFHIIYTVEIVER